MISSGYGIRYYGNTELQHQILSYFGLSALGTLLFATMLNNIVILLILLGAFLLFIGILLLSSLPKYNYYEITPEGIQSTYLGRFQRKFMWSTFDDIEIVAGAGMQGLGINYIPAHYPDRWGNFIALQGFGWDEFIPDAYGLEGESLAKDCLKAYTKYLRQK